ncbi:hypothetical protein [Priestia sp. J2]|uniref:hypothetical protein n=1 Tax=unclassified Priestia TaxID=2800374 RepID=UPI001E5D32C2|nr:hypothetical protein [Priestia sp. J2]
MIGILGYWVALLIWWLIKHFKGSSLGDIKDFMNGLPVGFWTLLTGILTAIVALATLLVTQLMNARTQKIQIGHQAELLEKQLSHQRELAQIEYFRDKRTEAILDFQKNLEESRGILEYFHSETADFERRMKLKIKYKKEFLSTYPKSQEHVIQEFEAENVKNMVECASHQLHNIEEKVSFLKTSFNLLVVYLEKDEENALREIVNDIDFISHYLTSKFKLLKEPYSSVHELDVLSLVHIYEPSIVYLQRSRIKLEHVRKILRSYLHFEK